MNFLLSMLAGVPGNFLYLYLPDRIGRISTLLVVELTLGMSCIVNAILLQSNSLEPIQIVFSMLGRFVASVSIKTCYLCTAELFPTQIRNTAIGVGSIFGGIGSILGKIIIKTYWSILFFLLNFRLFTGNVWRVLDLIAHFDCWFCEHFGFNFSHVFTRNQRS